MDNEERITNALVEIAILLGDLDAHRKQEGEPVQIRTGNGSWVDAEDRVMDIVTALSGRDEE